MKKMDKNKLYRLPWSNLDNPNGWIEITNSCQLNCPGCYRSSCPNSKNDKGLDELKKEIDFLIQHRNIETLSIAGGEPLLHKNLGEIISYAKNKKLLTMLITNGRLLDKKTLIRLHEKGLNHVMIHLGSYQYTNKTEKDINEIRKKYCKLFEKINKIKLGFIITISKQNISELDSILEFFRKNHTTINQMTFTVLKNISPYKKVEDRTRIDLYQIYNKIKNKLDIEFGAYLDKRFSDEPSWMFAFPVFSKNKTLGYLDGDMCSIFSRVYRKISGKYTFTINTERLSHNLLKLFVFNKSIRRILRNYKKMNKNQKITYNPIVLINPPDKTEQGWDYCNGCPDSMVYQNKLVPSCLIDVMEKEKKIIEAEYDKLPKK